MKPVRSTAAVLSFAFLVAGCADPELREPEEPEEAGVLQAVREFSCTGVQVPGDYATLQDAVYGMRQDGGTICLMPGTHAGDVHVPDNYEPALRITGASAETTRIEGHVQVESLHPTYGGVVLEGIEFRSGLTLQGVAPVIVRASTIRNPHGVPLSIYRPRGWASAAKSVVVDGCLIKGHAGARAVHLETQTDDESAESYSIVIANSIVESGDDGIYVYGPGTGPLRSTVAIVNNTIRRNGTDCGVFVAGHVLLHSFNNAIVENSTIGMRVVDPVALAHGHNFFGMNGANYSGFAPAASYMSGDPLLAGTPPAPAPGSPLLSGGTWLGTSFPWIGQDFHGRPRQSGKVDIGAVQSTPVLVDARVLFSQVGYDTPGDDSLEEFVELYNAGGTTVNLSGWAIEDNAGRWALPAGTTIAAHDYLTIARSAAGFDAWMGGEADHVGFALNLGNSGDGLVLRTAKGDAVDSLFWETGAWPTAATGQVLLRTSPGTDTDLPSDWLVANAPIPR